MALPPDPWPPRPFREPGSRAGFVDELKAAGKKWPLPPPEIDGDFPTATPYLVIPFDSNDTGARPLAQPVRRSQGVELIDSAGNVVTGPIVRVGVTYRLRATIRNLGATASYAGLCDFYLLPRTVANTAATIAAFGLASGPRSQARTGFVVRAGQMTTVESPNTWTPANKLESEFKVLVHAYDLLLDPLGVPFDWINNRHVARW